MSDVYGYVNGEAVHSRDEFIFKKRGFEAIEDDKELIEFAEKVSGHWYDAGHRRTFASYYLGDYALDEPKASLTDKEYQRLKALQKIEQDRIAEENAKYDYHRYEGRPLTESEVRMFLDRRVERQKEQWGEGNFYVTQAENYCDEALARFRRGEVIEVDSYDYRDSYGNGTGDYAKCLMSDGTIQTACYGYID